jgi:hypothetical protein
MGVCFVLVLVISFAPHIHVTNTRWHGYFDFLYFFLWDADWEIWKSMHAQ